MCVVARGGASLVRRVPAGEILLLIILTVMLRRWVLPVAHLLRDTAAQVKDTRPLVLAPGRDVVSSRDKAHAPSTPVLQGSW